MSGFLGTQPKPVNLGSMRSTDTDVSFGLDFTPNMTARSDTIVTFSALSIARVDGTAIVSGDLIATNLQVISGGLKIAWTFEAQGNVADYIASATVLTHNGSSLTRDMLISTVTQLG